MFPILSILIPVRTQALIGCRQRVTGPSGEGDDDDPDEHATGLQTYCNYTAQNWGRKEGMFVKFVTFQASNLRINYINWFFVTYSISFQIQGTWC